MKSHGFRVHFHNILFAGALAAFGVACGEGAPLDEADASPPDAIAQQPLTVQFAAHIGEEPFACGRSYAGIGASEAEYVGVDFRFFVHEVRLVDEAGAEEPLLLEQDGEWQLDALALLDFEDGSSACEAGNARTNSRVVGSAPARAYQGIRFKVGVPFERNHIDVATAPAPLNETAMFWVWRGGYKFLKADGRTGEGGETSFSLHVGSTGCVADAPTSPPAEACAHPNIIEVELADFDPTSDTIVADLAPVLAEVDVTYNTEGTAPGCMSAPDDPERALIFPRLGLPIGEQAAGTQALFRVQRP